jgi:hypothetical protein
MCPVVATASVVRVPAFRGFTGAAVKRSQAALEHPALRARLGTGAGRVNQTFSVIATLSRVCTDQIRQTTTLAETKRQVLISGKRSAGRKIKAPLVNPRQARTRTTGAAATTGHVPTVDNVSRVFDDKIRRRRRSYDRRRLHRSARPAVSPPFPTPGNSPDLLLVRRGRTRERLDLPWHPWNRLS